jgi:hypothetical protein
MYVAHMLVPSSFGVGSNLIKKEEPRQHYISAATTPWWCFLCKQHS